MEQRRLPVARKSVRPSRRGVDSTRNSSVWVPLLIGGIATAVLASQVGMATAVTAGMAGRWMNAWRGAGVRAALRRAGRVRDAVIGHDKRAVARVLGPPPTTVGARSLQAYLTADTWYYPMSNAHRVAIAIRFTDDIAQVAQILHVA